MRDHVSRFDRPLSGLSKADWRKRVEWLTRERGTFEELGTRHFSALISNRATLLVTFETMQEIRARDDAAQPVGWQMVGTLGWSHLALVSDGDTWFRDDAVYAFFDRLAETEFFDSFDRVLFYGAGPCGYAAAAFSVASPGATVLVIRPQATLCPDIAAWDRRFVKSARHREFTSRYGYAPDMIDACDHCCVVYDPLVALDAMHATLFRRPNVTLLPARRTGTRPEVMITDMGLLRPLLEQAVSGGLNRAAFARLMRARRDYPPYLNRLLAALDAEERDGLARRLRASITRRMHPPQFATPPEAATMTHG